MVRAEPTPHSPPMAMPNNARTSRSVPIVGANPEAISSSEYARMFQMSVGLRAESVREPAEQKRSDGAHAERQENRRRDHLHARMQLGGDILEHEDHEKEVERIQCPAQIRRDHDVALFLSPCHRRPSARVPAPDYTSSRSVR